MHYFFFVFWFRERIRGVFWGSDGVLYSAEGAQEIAMLVAQFKLVRACARFC